MPEILAEGPDLNRAGHKFHPDWLARWIANPRDLNRDARMPALVVDESGTLKADDSRVLDLAAYVSTLGAELVETEEEIGLDEETARRGGVLFAQLGCISCHLRPDRPPARDEHDRVPLENVAWKWQGPALVRFLRDPSRDDPWVRMPDLDLSEDEARSLAAFLIVASKTKVPGERAASALALQSGDPARGREWFLKLGCRGCHDAPGESVFECPPLEAIEKVDWRESGCAAEGRSPSTAVPDLGLGENDREALFALQSAGLSSIFRCCAADFAQRRLRDLHCNACHTIGGRHDRWQTLSSETLDLLAGVAAPALDQSRPMLTFVGEKLHTDWMANLLQGKVETRTRPWLVARMPSFPQNAPLLAEGLASLLGLPASRSSPESCDPEERMTAEKLLLEGGFSCVSCHDIGERAALSRFEFGTPPLDLAHERIRPEYYRRWMMNPLRVEPSSKMPQYAREDGTSPFTEYYGGDIGRQFEAIRLFLAQLSRAPAASED